MSRGVFCVLFNPPPTPLIFFFVSVCLSGLNVYINVHNYIADNIYIYTVTSLYIGKYIEPRICLCKRHQTFSKAVSLYFDLYQGNSQSPALFHLLLLKHISLEVYSHFMQM